METVWRYLTEAELRRQWFMGGTDALPLASSNCSSITTISRATTFLTPRITPARREAFSEKVIRFEPPRLLETTLPGGKNGVVTYELFPEGERTRLVLTHSGITSRTGAQDFGGGWNSHLEVLAELLAGRRVRNFWELHADRERKFARHWRADECARFASERGVAGIWRRVSGERGCASRRILRKGTDDGGDHDHPLASRDDWLAARLELLKAEKELTLGATRWRASGRSCRG